MSKYDEELEQPTQGQEVSETSETTEEVKETPVTGEETEGEKEQSSSPETVVTLLGRQYDLTKPDQVQALAKDYDRLGRMYAPLSQQVQELEARLEALQKPAQTTPDVTDPETVEYLKKLGFVHQSELQAKEEQERLEEYLSSLESEYDGSDGRPKFDRQEVLQFCVQNGIGDPHAGYKLLHEKELTEWALKNLSKNTQTPPPSVKGTSGPNIPKPKKVTLGMPESEEEIDLRTAIEQTLNEQTPKLEE